MRGAGWRRWDPGNMFLASRLLSPKAASYGEAGIDEECPVNRGEPGGRGREGAGLIRWFNRRRRPRMGVRAARGSGASAGGVVEARGWPRARSPRRGRRWRGGGRRPARRRQEGPIRWGNWWRIVAVRVVLMLSGWGGGWYWRGGVVELELHGHGGRCSARIGHYGRERRKAKRMAQGMEGVARERREQGPRSP
ncbi:hypothetical protein BS78_K124700 [Paspalum vaginatum]|uniref:Uncharacterized protein n=1 Tax=Paspalum vaginatum TaxID=158149 RepID=A0A9W7X953_9POAL|nr:hypothetical protein BS78_K124700 [Paspalum vaginatum]